MKFICMGFNDESKWESLPVEEGQRLMEACFAYADEHVNQLIAERDAAFVAAVQKGETESREVRLTGNHNS